MIEKAENPIGDVEISGRSEKELENIYRGIYGVLVERSYEIAGIPGVIALFKHYFKGYDSRQLSEEFDLPVSLIKEKLKLMKYEIEKDVKKGENYIIKRGEYLRNIGFQIYVNEKPARFDKELYYKLKNADSVLIEKRNKWETEVSRLDWGYWSSFPRNYLIIEILKEGNNVSIPLSYPPQEIGNIKDAFTKYINFKSPLQKKFYCYLELLSEKIKDLYGHEIRNNGDVEEVLLIKEYEQIKKDVYKGLWSLIFTIKFPHWHRDTKMFIQYMFSDLTFKEIGEYYSVSSTLVRQVVNKFLSRLLGKSGLYKLHIEKDEKIHEEVINNLQEIGSEFNRYYILYLDNKKVEPEPGFENILREGKELIVINKRDYILYDKDGNKLNTLWEIKNALKKGWNNIIVWDVWSKRERDIKEDALAIIPLVKKEEYEKAN